MRTPVFITIISLSLSLLAACNQSTPPAASNPAPAAQPAASAQSSSDPVAPKLRELSGKGATDCGLVKTQGQEEIKKASDCAMDAATNKKPFYVGYEMPGLVVGVAGNAEGKHFALQASQAGAGTKPQIQSAPCPADLRLAQSGRVTCMSPGSMGGTGSSPHGGGMPSAGGDNPHGGAMAAPPGTENPHGAVGTKPQSSGKNPPR
ncbi:MAG: hypothetical protein ACR2IF_08190 [Terriglobales bacterium]